MHPKKVNISLKHKNNESTVSNCIVMHEHDNFIHTLVSLELVCLATSKSLFWNVFLTKIEILDYFRVP